MPTNYDLARVVRDLLVIARAAAAVLLVSHSAEAVQSFAADKVLTPLQPDILQQCREFCDAIPGDKILVLPGDNGIEPFQGPISDHSGPAKDGINSPSSNGDMSPFGGPGSTTPPPTKPERRYSASTTPAFPMQESSDKNSTALVETQLKSGAYTAALLWLSAVSGIKNPYSADMQLGDWAYNAWGLEFGDAGNYNYGQTGYLALRPLINDVLFLDWPSDQLTRMALFAGSAVYQNLRGDRSELNAWMEDPKDVDPLMGGMDRGEAIYEELQEKGVDP